MSYFSHSELNLEKLEEKDMISFNWLWSKARIIYWGHLNDETTVVKKHVITIFLKRFNIRIRCRRFTKLTYDGEKTSVANRD